MCMRDHHGVLLVKEEQRIVSKLEFHLSLSSRLIDFDMVNFTEKTVLKKRNPPSERLYWRNICSQ